MLQETNLKHLEVLYRSIFEVSLYETGGNTSNAIELPSESAKKYLQDLISTKLHSTTLSKIVEEDNANLLFDSKYFIENDSNMIVKEDNALIKIALKKILNPLKIVKLHIWIKRYKNKLLRKS